MQIGNLLISRRLIIVVAMVILVVSSIVGYSYINSDLNYSASISVKAPPKEPPKPSIKLYDMLADNSVYDNGPSDYVEFEWGIDFAKGSSDTNGKGIYLYSRTENEEYPIYYYRGAVTNNNALFAGFCWKVVRTTETGGTKLIYNGLPNENNECINSGNDSIISKSAVNTNHNSIAYNGYMYGTPYEYSNGTTTSSYKYGKTVSYNSTTGMYTLNTTRNGIDTTHHYTCLNTSTSCTQVYYVYFYKMPNIYYITLTGGKDVYDAISDMNANTNSSVLKTTVDDWFINTFNTYFINNSKDYNDYLEDTVWCAERKINTLGSDSTIKGNGWNPDGGVLSYPTYYETYGREKNGYTNLLCRKNDAYTVNDTVNGNGALTYPVGLLTSDEVILAGGQAAYGSYDFYLYSGTAWWTMSPHVYYNDSAANFLLGSDGLTNVWVSYAFGVRPSISLKNGIMIKSGNGEATTPYVIE